MSVELAPGERIEVVELGLGRLRVRGARPGSEASGALVAWLRDRSEVVRIEQRDTTGTIDVRYEVPRSGARCPHLARDLEDHVHTLALPAPVEREVSVVHAVSGRARLRITGHADHSAIASWLASRPGVLRASASPVSESVLVLYDPAVTDLASITRAIEHTPEGELGPAPAEVPSSKGRWALTALNTAVFAACASAAAPVEILGALVAITAVPPLKRALTAVSEGRFSVDMLDVAAISIAVGTGQVVTGSFITWLLGIGDLLLSHSADRARSAITHLMRLDTNDAWRLEGDVPVRVAASSLVEGDRIVVEAGQSIAADGTVVSGLATVDEKALTGESDPKTRHPGDRVLAATVVAEGQLVVRVDRAGGDTTAAKIVKILGGASAKPMTLQRESEKVADRLVLPTFALAAAASALTGQLDRATSVLITDFGTGLRIAVPTAALASMAAAARDGVLVKGAQYLERLARTDTIVFDKTGTLTLGAPSVVDVTARGGFSMRELLSLSAAAEARQSHPIAEAVRHHAQEVGFDRLETELGSEQYSIGKGLSVRIDGRTVRVGSGRFMRQHGVDTSSTVADAARHRALRATPLYVAVDGSLAGVFLCADRARVESAAVVRALRANGRRKVVLYSGDGRDAVEALAREVGVDEAEGELLPQDKADRVRAFQREGRTVAMVGDGINDAPALAVADVGISLEGGTDVALETADVVLLEGGLARLPRAFEVGDRAMRTVRRGIGMVIVPNAVAIGLGALGLLPPTAAALVNNGSTVAAAIASFAPLWTK